MRHLICAALAVGLLLASVDFAWTQTAPATSATPPPPARVNPKTAALVRRMFKATKIDITMDAMMGSMLPVMVDSMVRQYPNVTAQEKDVILQTGKEALHDFMAELMERMVPIYAETYSQEELEAIDTFYESPIGQSLITKTPLMAPKTAALTREMLPGLQVQMQARLCEKLDCRAKKPRPPQPS
jgi:hypothetical protein